MLKKDLELEIAQLKDRNNAFSSKDERIRKELSGLLDSYEYEGNNSVFRSPSKTIAVGSWLQIAFWIGELKADADYAMVLQARDNFREEANMLRKKINELQNPEEINNNN